MTPSPRRSVSPLTASLAAATFAAVLFAQEPTPAPQGQGGGIPECKEMQTTPSGLQWGVLKAGSEAPHPTADDVVTVHYTGWLTDGTKFDSSHDRGQPFTTPLNQVVKGWTEGVQLMTPGARFKFVIPPELGYGARNMGKIPPNSTLVFEVELLKVKTMPKMPTLPKGDPAAQKTCENGLKYEYLKHGTGAQMAAKGAGELRFALFAQGQLAQCTEQQGVKLGGTATTLEPVFLRELLPTLKVGDVLRLEVPGKLMPRPNTPDTVWEIELLATYPEPKLPEFKPSDEESLTTTASGLKYEVKKPGTGRKPTAADTVRVHYTGWLVDGKKFDSSHERGVPIEFPLGGVIPGWTEGLQLMQEGAIYQFVIPPQLGYGGQGQGEIPPNSTLVFLVELLEVK